MEFSTMERGKYRIKGDAYGRSLKQLEFALRSTHDPQSGCQVHRSHLLHLIDIFTSFTSRYIPVSGPSRFLSRVKLILGAMSWIMITT